MDKYTISEIERKFGYSNSKIRRLIKKRVLPITTEKRDSREVTVVLVENENQFRLLFGDHDYQPNNHIDEVINRQVDEQVFQKIEEAEIIKESSDYQLMSMEQTSFDELIQSIKEMADDRSKTERESYKKLEDQHFSLQAEIKIKNEEIKKYIENIHAEKLKAAQVESELKIQKLRIEELTEKLEEKDKKITELQAQQNANIWFKKL